MANQALPSAYNVHSAKALTAVTAMRRPSHVCGTCSSLPSASQLTLGKRLICLVFIVCQEFFWEALGTQLLCQVIDRKHLAKLRALG